MSQTKTYQIFIPTGPAYETKEQSGISHFVEHIIFSHSFAKSGLASFCSKKGINLSVSTSHYFTSVIVENLNENLLPKIEKEVGDLILNPILNEESIAAEKAIIAEEINYRSLFPDLAALERLYSRIFLKTTLEFPIIGLANTVQNLTLEKIIKWHERFFKSEKMLTLVFDQEIGKLFVKSYPSKLKTPPVSISREDHRSNEILKSGVENIAWTLENPTSKQQQALDVIRRMFDHFLYNEIIQKKHLAYSATTYLEHFKDLDFLYCQVFSTQPKKTSELVIQYMERIAAEEIDRTSLKKMLEEEVNYFSLPDQAMPYVIGKEFCALGMLQLPQDRIKTLKEISISDLATCANQLLETGTTITQ